MKFFHGSSEAVGTAEFQFEAVLSVFGSRNNEREKNVI